MIKELLPTEPVDMLQQGDPVVQAPKQDPPYKKKVYDKLVSSFEDCLAKLKSRRLDYDKYFGF